ncbi:hypothetical protein [Citrobacter rodentium]|jgi:hypothetical protein|nr:hypothetical protein [Citrobacter rodentium]KIQ49158.1 hypothetical protein TA05_22605 [Citrobacter rodentium]QBY28473.1 hypothetical protein E2R62_06160 [Citrobacter rodentium]UHO29654.1 hypothetical protein K7R23_16680 [Citrobacter rodentium NBRC 105723 = DSM 16636]HAT8014953.1 hypothetical protein [Citrobacter rodentium NBRC 105723 = DSM 16636]HAT8019951.1 hypothetical protein [Citrobacter rodentium]
MLYYVWGVFNYPLPVPKGDSLHKASKNDCHFYPFNHSGNIFTIDSMLWHGGNEIFSPGLKCIEEEILLIKKKNLVNLMAITTKTNTPTIVFNSELEAIPEAINDIFLSTYINIGFDIVDAMGVSGLVNIGFNNNQTTHIKSLNIKINKFGLLDDYKQAEKLSYLLSSFAPEHCYFTPVNIWKANK